MLTTIILPGLHESLSKSTHAHIRTLHGSVCNTRLLHTISMSPNAPLVQYCSSTIDCVGAENEKGSDCSSTGNISLSDSDVAPAHEESADIAHQTDRCFGKPDKESLEESQEKRSRMTEKEDVESAINDCAREKDSDELRKGVQFSTLTVREYPICIGDNPGGTSGVPLSIGWSYENEVTCTVDDYETARPRRRSATQMQVPAQIRSEMLINMGYSRSEIREGAEHAAKFRPQANRRRTPLLGIRRAFSKA